MPPPWHRLQVGLLRPRVFVTFDLLTIKVERFMPSPWTTCACLHRNRMACFQNTVYTILTTDECSDKRTNDRRTGRKSLARRRHKHELKHLGRDFKRKTSIKVNDCDSGVVFSRIRKDYDITKMSSLSMKLICAHRLTGSTRFELVYTSLVYECATRTLSIFNKELMQKS